MATLVLLWTMFRYRWIELKRYPFNTISAIVSVYLFFFVVFLGVRSFADTSTMAPGGAIDTIVVGFSVWFLTLFAFIDVAFTLTREAQRGTLEQLAMSPLGLGRTLICSTSAAFFFNLALVGVLLLLMMATTGNWLNLDLVSLLPLVVLTVAGAQAIGFLMGGMALIFKQIEASFGILQFVFIGFLAVPLDRFPAARHLPLAWGNHLINRVMRGGASLAEMAAPDLGYLVVNSAVYLGLGLLAFKLLEREARKRGLLGHY